MCCFVDVNEHVLRFTSICRVQYTTSNLYCTCHISMGLMFIPFLVSDELSCLASNLLTLYKYSSTQNPVYIVQ